MGPCLEDPNRRSDASARRRHGQRRSPRAFANKRISETTRRADLSPGRLIGLNRCGRDLLERNAAALDDGEHPAVCLRHLAILRSIRQSDDALEMPFRRRPVHAAPELCQIPDDAFVETHDDLLLASARHCTGAFVADARTGGVMISTASVDWRMVAVNQKYGN